MWDVEGTDEFGEWYGSLGAEEQKSVNEVVTWLEAEGPNLKRPSVGTLRASKYANLKELRVNVPPIRIFFAFDPRRTALLLIGGDKANDPRFYDRMIPVAEALYEHHLSHLEDEHAE